MSIVPRSSPAIPSEHRAFTAPPRVGEIPLTPAQERLWLLDQMEPGGSSYHIPVALRLRGDLRPRALRRALHALMDRHEALRSIITLAGNRPVLRVAERVPAAVESVHLKGLPPQQREERAQEICRQETLRPFSLGSGPLIRHRILRLGRDDHLLLIVVHHIVFDGWSLGVYLRELALLYNAFREDRPSPLPDPRRQFQDYARWLCSVPQPPAAAGPAAAGPTGADGEPPAIDLLADRPRGAPGERSGRVPVFIPDSAARRFAELCGRERVTVFMTLLAGYTALLYLWTGKRDQVIDVPSAGRGHAELEGIIGLFVETQSIHTRVSGSMRFVDLLRSVRAETLQALESHGGPPRSELTMVLQNLPPMDLRLRDLTVEPFPFEAGLSRPGLSLLLGEEEGSIGGIFSYAEGLFDRRTVERLGADFARLLEEVSRDPLLRLVDIPLRPRASASTCRGPTDPFVAFPASGIEQSIPRRFEEQVDADPARIAIIGRDAVWTYGELDRRANAVAEALLSRGGGAGGRAALLYSHEPPMIAAMLGALKAGITYVPLDPRHPRWRLARVLRQSDCGFLLAQPAHAELARSLDAASVVVTGEAETPVRPRGLISPSAPAYILFTSGTTGEPKGVVQSHRNVLHHIRVYTNNLHINARDRLSLLSSYCFDAAVMDIYGALLNGASLALFDAREQGVLDLADWLPGSRVTIYHSTPTLFRCAFADGQDPLPAVRLVVLGGEAATTADLDLFRRRFPPGCLLVNGLGPTESTVSLQFFADRSTTPRGFALPVGRPVEGTEITLLSGDGEPDIQGEITIRSAHLALGYWARPDLTAASFADDPARPTVRTYRTGDIGRRLPDGDIVFVGRKDAQVKIRGYRVEPSESEVLLGEMPGVRDCAVVARGGASGEMALSAYVVPSGATAPDPTGLRAALRESLPDYCVPATITMVDSLPLAANGKLDVQALPPPDLSGRPQAFVPPRDEAETRVAECFQAVLQRGPVGALDDFFERGGTSISAARLIAALRTLLGVQVPLRSLFLDSTVERLAQMLRRDPSRGGWRYRERGRPWSFVVPMQTRGARPPLFLVAGAYDEERSLRYLSHLVPHLGSDQPVYGLCPRDGDGGRVVSVEQIAAQYLGEVRRFLPNGPYLLGGECAGGVIAYEMARQLSRDGRPVDLLVLLDTFAPTLLNAIRLRVALRLRQLVRFLRATMAASRNGLHHGAAHVIRSVLRIGSRIPGARSAPQRAESERRAWSRTIYRYVASPQPGRLTLLVNEVEYARHADLGWREFSQVDVHVVPGDHLSRLTSHAGSVAAVLTECLGRAVGTIAENGRGADPGPAQR